MKNRALLFLAVAFTFARESAGQALFERPHDVMVEAIKHGEAHGILRGRVAELFTKQFKSNGALLVDATVIASFPRADCKRIQVIYTKKAVTTAKGTTDLVMNTKLNYCLDGKAPMGQGVTR